MNNLFAVTLGTDNRSMFTVFLAIMALAMLVVSSFAHAEPPAVTASCAGIKEAYPILGGICENQYARIRHAPANATERFESFVARKAVLEIFKKATLCNGMYGADKTVQQRFKSGQSGHLQQLAHLRQAMVIAGDPDIPNVYTKKELNRVTINKQQCK